MNANATCGMLGDAIKDRGFIYLAVFREISRRHGKDEAISVMRAASRAHGIVVGESLAHLGPSDFQGLLDGFFKAPDDGATFSPDVRRLDEAGLEVKMMTCPLKQSWVEAGCSDDEICTLLHCASAFDTAVMDAAGFDLDLDLWSPGKDGCCHSKITAKG